MKAKFNLLSIIGIAILFIWPGYAASQEPLDSIYIVTPDWEDQTHADGSGLFFDIIRKVYEPSGIKLKFEIMPWARAEDMINRKLADALPAQYKDGAGIFPSYHLYVDYTIGVFKKERIKEWKGLQTIKGKSATWIRGYNFHEIPALSTLELQWTEIDDYSQAWNLLAHDRVEVYIESLIDLDRYIPANKIDMNPYQTEILVGRNAYLMFSDTDKSKKLIEIYNRRFPELVASGEVEALFKQWRVKFEPFDPAND